MTEKYSISGNITRVYIQYSIGYQCNTVMTMHISYFISIHTVDNSIQTNGNKWLITVYDLLPDF